MNNSDAIWIIHEPRLGQMQGMEGEAVVGHRETRHNPADVVRLARPKGKNGGYKKRSFLKRGIGRFYE